MAKSKKAQMLVVGLMIMAMAMIIFISLIPAIQDVMNNARKASSLNCKSYVDRDDASESYNSSLDSNALACTILDLGIPYLVLGVLVALVAKLIHGQLVEPPTPQVPAYGYSY